VIVTFFRVTRVDTGIHGFTRVCISFFNSIGFASSSRSHLIPLRYPHYKSRELLIEVSDRYLIGDRVGKSKMYDAKVTKRARRQT